MSFFNNLFKINFFKKLKWKIQLEINFEILKIIIFLIVDIFHFLKII